MAAKKTTAATAAAKTAEKKATETKATVETKPAKAVKKEAKTEVVKEETKKTVKTVEKKPAVKKTTTRKTTSKKVTKTQEVFVQFCGREVAAADIMEKVEKAWADMGNKAEDVKDVKIYIKPEEFMAYYVINDNEGGSVEL